MSLSFCFQLVLMASGADAGATYEKLAAVHLKLDSKTRGGFILYGGSQVLSEDRQKGCATCTFVHATALHPSPFAKPPHSFT